MNKTIGTYIFHILVLTMIIVAGPACSKDGVFKKSGPVKSEIRQLGPIVRIVLYDKVNLILTQDAVQQVRIETGENLLSDIETSLSGNTLTIRDNNKHKWLRDLDTKVNVYLSTNQLQQIDYYGAGDISCTNELTPEKFGIDSWTGTGNFRLKMKTENTVLVIRTGNADISIEGSSTSCSVYCADQGSVDLRNYVATYAFVRHLSVRDSYIHAKTELNADILYTGNIYYRGNPLTLKSTTTSTGRLIQIP